MNKKLFLYLALLIPLICCQDHISNLPITNADEREVEIEILNRWISTRAAINEENRIERLDILVFDGDTEHAQFLYRRYAFPNNNMNAYRATLKTGNGLTLYFVANMKDLLDGIPELADNSGATWKEIREKLVMENPEDLNHSDGLPMWGSLHHQNIENQPITNLGRVHMLRSVASADFELTAPASEFQLTAVHVVYGADKGYLPYDPEKIQETTNSIGETKIFADSPYVPDDMQPGKDWEIETKGLSKVENLIYMFDNDAEWGPTGKQTKLVMEGKWLDPSGNGRVTFYPIAFRDVDNAGKATKQKVIRNNKYIIQVTGINGDGFSSLEDAKRGEEVNISYKVIPWEDVNDTEIIVAGNEWISIERRYASMQRGSGTSDHVSMQTSYTPEDIVISKYPDFSQVSGVGGNAIYLDDPKESNFCGISLTESGGKFIFTFTARVNIDPLEEAGYYHQSTLYVRAGRIEFSILARQHNISDSDWNQGGDISWPWPGIE